jgi:hypothetical protein
VNCPKAKNEVTEKDKKFVARMVTFQKRQTRDLRADVLRMRGPDAIADETSR